MADKITIRIFNDSYLESCYPSGGWGPKWSLAEITSFIADGLKKKFGDAVQVEYCDLAKPRIQEEYSDVVEMLKQKKLSLPLVYVDDVLEVAGWLEYREIATLVEAKMKESVHSET